MSNETKVTKFEKPVENARLLISLVETRPELYDPNHKNYSNRLAHDKAWKDLAAKMNVPLTDFRAKWNSLRNSYARSVRARYLKPNRSRQSWYLEKHMSFLKKHIKNRSVERRHYFINFDMPNATEDIRIERHSSISPSPPNKLNSSRKTSESVTTITPTRSEGTSIKSSKSNHDGIKNDDEDILSISSYCSSNCTVDESQAPEQKHFIKNKIKNKKSLNKKMQKQKHKLKEMYHGCEKLYDNLMNFYNYEKLQNVRNSNDLFFQSIQKDYQKLSDRNKRKFKLLALSSLNNMYDDSD